MEEPEKSREDGSIGIWTLDTLVETGAKRRRDRQQKAIDKDYVVQNSEGLAEAKISLPGN